MNRISICFVILFSTFYNTSYGQEDSSREKAQRQTFSNEFNVSVIKVRDSIFMLKGKGGNIGLLIGAEGAVLVDSQFSESTPNILNAVSNLTPQPVQFVIYTQHHEDHSGGVKNMREAGIIGLSHINVRKNLYLEGRKKVMDSIEKTIENKIAKSKDNQMSNEELETAYKEEMSQTDFDFSIDPLTLPMVAFSENFYLYSNDEEIEIYHLPNAHTSGDVIVYFKTTNVLHTGDAYIKDKYPHIDSESGGTFEGYKKGLDKILSLINEETLIIPGHGDIAKLADVRYSRSMLEFITNRIAYHRVDKKTEEEVVAMKNLTQEYDLKGFGTGFISTEDFVRAVYKEAARKYRW